jgi:uncharacterized membrane protein (DUF485 family)
MGHTLQSVTHLQLSLPRPARKIGAAEKLKVVRFCIPVLAIAFKAVVGYNTARPMHDSKSEKKTDMHSEEFLHSLMRKQLKLSVACALSFLLVVLGLPLANYFAPEFMAQRIFGFTLTWFLLGIGFFPAVWVISYYFIKRSIRLEEEEVAEVVGDEREKGGKGAGENSAV